ncbi:MAG: CHAT domain-containing protein, partial [Acidobacteria bacterium]
SWTAPWEWNEERLVEELTRRCLGHDWSALLTSCRQLITLNVIRLLKEKVAYLIRVDIRRAVKLAETTRAAAILVDDPRAEALAQHATALALHFSGQYRDALQAYERAEAIYRHLNEDVQAARITRAKLGVLMYLGDYRRALDEAGRAAAVFQRHGEPVLLGQTWENLGSLYHRLDRYREALDYYDRAREIYRAHHFEFGLASVSFNAAIQYTHLNDFRRALRLYQEARRIYQKLDMPLLVNETDYTIAWLYAQCGRFQESLELFAKVIARARQLGDRAQEAWCELDMTEVYLQLNACEDAIESARLAAETFQALHMTQEMARARMYLGIAHAHVGHWTMAQRELEHARRCFLAEGNAVLVALTNVHLSEVFMQRRDWHGVEQLCREARRLFARRGLTAKAAWATVQLARAKLLSDDPLAAQRLCRAALRRLKSVDVPWLQYQCWALLGKALERMGRPRRAYQSYLRAIAYLEELHHHIRVDEFKRLFLKDKLAVYEDLVELCLREGTEEKAEEAFRYLESAKSRALVDQLAIVEHDVRRANEPERREWMRLREALNWTYSRIHDCETRAGGRSHALLKELRATARRQERELARVVRHLHVHTTRSLSLAPISGLAVSDVRRCLAEDEVLIEYVLIGDRVKVLLLDEERVHVLHDLGSATSISSLLQQLAFCIDKFALGRRFVVAHWENISRFTDWCLGELYGALIEPLAHLIEGKKIILVPHGLLHGVPFHALYDGRQYLIERHELSYAPSARIYTLCVESAGGLTADGPAVIVGVPDESTPFIREEVAAVQSIWPQARAFVGQAAAFARLKTLLGEAQMVHIASHATFRRDHPMFSALTFADGPVSVYDIAHLRLTAGLVTLSACESGLNEVAPGDELLGFMRGFLSAGAASLVMSLWVVNDRSTAELMTCFYRGLRQGFSKRAALRRAQLEIKRRYPHPYYWAPFILTGAPA